MTLLGCLLDFKSEFVDYGFQENAYAEDEREISKYYMLGDGIECLVMFLYVSNDLAICFKFYD